MTVSITALAGTAVAALVLTDVLSGVLRALALRYGFTDRPRSHGTHVRPTPYLGGVAMAIGTLGPVAVVLPRWGAHTGVIAAMGAAVAGLGLIDDLRPLTPSSRLLVEGLAATAVVVSGGRSIEVFGGWLDPVATGLWIVIITNSFNLLDNMDGAAATVAAVTSGFLAGAAYMTGQTGLALLLLALSAGCLGFLIHNWAPARMFMGDSGSLFIGFVIASAAVSIEVPDDGAGTRLAELLLVTFVATVDTCLVVISRHLTGRSWLTGGTDHMSHRLRRLGWSVRQVSLTLLVATAASCLCGVLVSGHRLPGPGALGAAVTLAVTLVWLLLKVPGYAALPEPARTPASEPVPASAPPSVPVSAPVSASGPVVPRPAPPPVPADHGIPLA
jgi:UDP-GlcNAc:undecaprenyl-phosphate/decaprenyl-phosphate GlcNAc-1-phosphate transferase